MKNHPFDAIIFDHDGTLIDTELPDFLGWQALYREYGLTLTLEYWASVAVGHIGGSQFLIEDMINKHGNGLTPAVLRNRIQQLWSVTFTQVELMPGVVTLLEQLRAAGYPLAIATASDRAWLDRWLPRFNLNPYFPVIATRDDVVNPKPAPDVYLFAAKKLGVDPGRCLVFEDSQAGLRAAKAAGMTVVAVPSHVTRSLDFSRADEIVASLENVNLTWIEQLPKR
jgi:HAD superfamily hydrolase (TIGR01509 family)